MTDDVIDINAKRDALKIQRIDADEKNWYVVRDAIAAAMLSLPLDSAPTAVLRAMLDTLQDNADMTFDPAYAMIEDRLKMFRVMNDIEGAV